MRLSCTPSTRVSARVMVSIQLFFEEVYHVGVLVGERLRVHLWTQMIWPFILFFWTSNSRLNLWTSSLRFTHCNDHCSSEWVPFGGHLFKHRLWSDQGSRIGIALGVPRLVVSVIFIFHSLIPFPFLFHFRYRFHFIWMLSSDQLYFNFISFHLHLIIYHLKYISIIFYFIFSSIHFHLQFTFNSFSFHLHTFIFHIRFVSWKF